MVSDTNAPHGVTSCCELHKLRADQACCHVVEIIHTSRTARAAHVWTISGPPSMIRSTTSGRQRCQTMARTSDLHKVCVTQDLDKRHSVVHISCTARLGCHCNGWHPPVQLRTRPVAALLVGLWRALLQGELCYSFATMITCE